MLYSIMMPCYNSEKTITKAINSVRKQKNTNWELLIMDDGSNDSTSKIIESFQDVRIKIYKQKNSGPGTARNNLIERATGDYFIFLDSDDFLSENFLKEIDMVLSQFKYDLLFINVKYIDTNEKIIKNQNISKYLKHDKNHIISCQVTGLIPWGAVRKIYSRNLILNHNIRFLETKVGEESIFSFKALYFSNNYKYVEKSIYYYVNSPNSLSKAIINNQYKDVISNLEFSLDEMNEEAFMNSLNTLKYISSILQIRYNLYMNPKYNITESMNEANNYRPSLKFMNSRFKIIRLLSFSKLYLIVKLILLHHIKRTIK